MPTMTNVIIKAGTELIATAATATYTPNPNATATIVPADLTFKSGITSFPSHQKLNLSGTDGAYSVPLGDMDLVGTSPNYVFNK